jgi:hypothetical protein
VENRKGRIVARAARRVYRDDARCGIGIQFSRSVGQRLFTISAKRDPCRVRHRSVRSDVTWEEFVVARRAATRQSMRRFKAGLLEWILKPDSTVSHRTTSDEKNPGTLAVAGVPGLFRTTSE